MYEVYIYICIIYTKGKRRKKIGEITSKMFILIDNLGECMYF